MAESLATLGLIVDASGAKREIKLTTDQLKTLANGGKEAAAVLKNIAPPATVQQMERVTKATSANIQAVTQATAQTKKLQNAFQAMAMSAINAAPGVGQLTSVIGSFALSGPVMIGVLAGLAALAFAWDRAGSAAKKAKEEQQSAIGVLQTIRDKNRNPILGGLPSAITGAEMRKQDLEADVAALRATHYTKARDAAIAAKQREINDLTNLIQHGHREEQRLTDEHNAEMLRKAQEAADKEIAEAKRLSDARRALDDYQSGLVSVDLPGTSVMRSGATGPVAGMTFTPAMVAQVAQIGQRSADAIKGAERTAQILTEVTDKQQRNQQLLQAGLAMLSKYGGAAGGIASAAISGFQSGGPWGMAIGGGMALVDTIVNFGRASREAARAMEALRVSFNDTILSWKAELGMPGADKALQESRIHQQADDARKALAQIYKGYDPVTGMALPGSPFMGTKLKPEALADYQRQLAEINKLEAERIAALGKEAQALKANDLRQSIEGLTRLIDSLAEFQGSLKLGDLSVLSPVQKLAEARRQYEEIYNKARLGNQDAANQLPAFAQAFLQASRSVNASGAAYQRDFARVVADTDEVMKLFEAQRTIAQKQLDVLMGIQTGLAETAKTQVTTGQAIVEAIQDMTDVLTGVSQTVEYAI